MFFLGVLSSLCVIAAGYTYHENFSICWYIFAFSLFTLCLATSVKFDLLHPFVWFNIPFMLYSIAGPLLYLTSGFPDHNNFPQTLLLEYLAIVTFSLFVGFQKRSYLKINLEGIKYLLKGNKLFFLANFLLAMLLFVALFMSDITLKQERNIQFSSIYMMDFVFYFMTISISVFLINLAIRKHRKQFIIYSLLFAIFLLITLMITGERGLFYRFVVIAIVIYYVFFQRTSKAWILIFVVLGLYAQYFLGSIKMVLLAKELGGDLQYSIDMAGIIGNIFGSELITPSDNLALLLQEIPNRIPFLNGTSFAWDIKRAFIPGMLFPREIFRSTDGWFTETFYPNLWSEGGGVGFTLVGCGYINFGIMGVLILFAFLGIAMRLIYKISTATITTFIFYVNFIPILIQTIRSDLSMPIAQGIKHTFLPLLILLLVGRFFNSNAKNSIELSKAIETTGK